MKNWCGTLGAVMFLGFFSTMKCFFLEKHTSVGQNVSIIYHGIMFLQLEMRPEMRKAQSLLLSSVLQENLQLQEPSPCDVIKGTATLLLVNDKIKITSQTCSRSNQRAKPQLFILIKGGCKQRANCAVSRDNKGEATPLKTRVKNVSIGIL